MKTKWFIVDENDIDNPKALQFIIDTKDNVQQTTWVEVDGIFYDAVKVVGNEIFVNRQL